MRTCAAVTTCVALTLAPCPAAADEFVVGSEWVGTQTRTAPTSATVDARLKVTKRDGEKFTAEYWANQGTLGLEIEGTVGRGGVVTFKATRKLKGEPAKGTVGGGKFTGELDGPDLSGDFVIPPDVVGKIKLRLKTE